VILQMMEALFIPRINKAGTPDGPAAYQVRVTVKIGQSHARELTSWSTYRRNTHQCRNTSRSSSYAGRWVLPHDLRHFCCHPLSS